PKARTEDGDQRCGDRRGDPGRACGDAIPRRRLPQGPGALGAWGIATGGKHVLRLTRAHQLLAPWPLRPPWRPGPCGDDQRRGRTRCGARCHPLLATPVGCRRTTGAVADAGPETARQACLPGLSRSKSLDTWTSIMLGLA